jgi:cobalamin biosynthesis protein CobD/CbiB
MADEFIKGLTLSMVGALGWFIFAGWYRTPEYYAIEQLTAAAIEPNNVYQAIGIFAGDVSLWLMLLGALVYWVVIPALRETRRSMTESPN